MDEAFSHDNLIEQMVLSDEWAATRQFLRVTARLIRDVTWGEFEDEHVLTAVLSTGVEKLLKLTYGLIRADMDGDAWPRMELRRFGHRVSILDARCRQMISARLEHAVRPAQVREALDQTAEDRYIAPLLNLAQNYAMNGRFYNLDRLGSPTDSQFLSPRDHWRRLTAAIYQERPGTAAGSWSWTPAEWDANYNQILPTLGRNSTVLDSFQSWSALYETAWANGVCGQRAVELIEDRFPI